MPSPRRHIVHVVFRLDIGGLENGLVNLINRMPEQRFAHSIVCLTDYSDFSARIRRDDVRVFSLAKRPGNDPAVQIRLWRLLRHLNPDIVHTRNLPTLECVPAALFAGVRCRVHGEHGWDVYDLYGKKSRYRLLRRALSPFITGFVAVSRHLERWLVDTIGIPVRKVRKIYNGVDTDVFLPAVPGRGGLLPKGFAEPDCIVIGSVGRLQAVKDQMSLVKAFLRLRDEAPALSRRCRLILIGAGPCEDEIRKTVSERGLREQVWMPGSRDDVAELMREFDLFVLPSLNEGTSNTILEAMATGLPVVATDVGGNGELVGHDINGYLVPAADADAMAGAIRRYVRHAELRRRHGEAGRASALASFSIHRMVSEYTAAYDWAFARAHGYAEDP